MKDSKLQNIKIMSSVVCVLALFGTLIMIGGEIDSINANSASGMILIIIFGIITIISFMTAVISSNVLRKRQGSDYWSVFTYIQALFETFFPCLTSSHSVKMKMKNVSEKNKKTNFWKDLCTGYDMEGIISFMLWLLFWCMCVVGLIICIINNNMKYRFLYIVSITIALIVVTFIVIFASSGIKKDPTAIFKYMEITQTKFSELAEHYDTANIITRKIRVDYKYVFIQAKGKTYCIPIDNYIDMSITLSGFYYIMVLTSTYDSVMKSSFSPVGFEMLKSILESANAK